MLVDDSDLALASLGLWLRRHLPLNVLGQASDGQEGLELVCRLQPDLVITDLRMPRLDGFRLVETLRQRFPAMKLIIASSDETTAIHVASLQRGADAFIPKNRLPEELPAVITHLFPKAAETTATCNV